MYCKTRQQELFGDGESLGVKHGLKNSAQTVARVPGGNCYNAAARGINNKENSVTSELLSLTWVTALTAVMWMPYILNAILVRGIIDAVGYPEDPKPLAPWASRMKAAHFNAVENLVVFAGLVLIAHAAGVSNETTVQACNVYLWARVVHFIAYGFAIPWVRTLSFLIGFGCQIAILLQLI